MADSHLVVTADADGVGWWPIDNLPTPISDFTERRIGDPASGTPAAVARVDRRHCRGSI